jgi:hypothetical protein
MNQGTKLVLLMKKKRSQKSRASVPLRFDGDILYIKFTVSVQKLNNPVGTNNLLRSPEFVIFLTNPFFKDDCRQLQFRNRSFFCLVIIKLNNTYRRSDPS